MICAECPNLIIEKGLHKCSYFVDADGNQLLSPFILWIKVEMKSKPRLCDVDKKGDDDGRK